jgi:hypothetical protein
MVNNSTILYINDKTYKPLERLIDIGQFLDEIDTTLDEFFDGVEIDVSSQLVSTTMTKIKECL